MLASKSVILLNRLSVENDSQSTLPCDNEAIRTLLDDHADLLFKLDQAMRAIKTLSPRDASFIEALIPNNAANIKLKKDLKTYASLVRQVK
jgi:hypothetical protein